jgi:ABC-type xylose transport system permease subunit
VKQKLRAYGAALAVFAALTVGENLYLKYHPLMTGDNVAIFIFNLEGFLAFVAPGYVAALIARRQGILVGALAGLLAACAFFLYVFLFRHVIYHDWYGIFIWGTVLGGLGGLLWTLQGLVIRFTRPGSKTNST